MTGTTELAAAARVMFSKTWGFEPAFIASSPGRVNLIGEHTDYNDGFVFPVAIDRRTVTAVGEAGNRGCGVVSGSREGTVFADCPPWRPLKDGCWANYLLGVADQLSKRGHRVPSFNAAVTSDLTEAAGLSSSAALEAAAATALAALAGASFSKTDLAAICQKAEHEFAGVRCGIMDQMASIVGGAIVLDCRSLEYESVSLPSDVSLVILDSGIPRGLSSTHYNERRGQCEEGVRLLRERHPAIAALRDVDAGMLNAARELLPDTVFRRCRHVVSENSRVIATKKALDGNDMQTVGRLLAESHRSMRDDYEISLPEIDRLVEIAVSTPGCHGARLTGAGFGGAVISLVDGHSAERFGISVMEQYCSETGRTGSAMLTVPDEGSRLETGW